METQFNKGQSRRVMYLENKAGPIDGAEARIGWVTFSRTGNTVYYRGRTLLRGNMTGGNFFDEDTHETYWVSGVKKRGSNSHPAERSLNIEVDADALEEYRSIRAG